MTPPTPRRAPRPKAKALAEVGWIEPFARPGLLLRTIGRAYGAALIAFSPVPILGSLGRPIAVPVLFGMLVFAGIVVPIAMLLLDRRAVSIGDAVRVRGARGALRPQTIALARIGRAEIVPERALGSSRAHTLRLLGTAAPGAAPRELAAVGLGARDIEPESLAFALRARGVGAAVVARAGERQRRLGVPVAVLVLLVAGTVWSARAASEIVAARSPVDESATPVAIRCLTVAPGSLTVRVVLTGELLDVRVGPKRYLARELGVDRNGAETVLRVPTGNLDARTQKFVSVSAGQPDHSVDSDGAPFDATDDRPQGPRC